MSCGLSVLERRSVATWSLALAAALALPPPSRAAPPPRWILAYAGSAPGHGPTTYTVDDFTRLITVVDSAGQSRFWLTTGAIFLQLFAPSGRILEPALGGTPADGTDWAAYLDSLFAASGMLKRLDSAMALATAAIGPPADPYQVSVMIPYPDPGEARLEFRGGGFDLRKPRGRRDVALAYVDEVARRFQAAGFHNLTLDGFYWLHELMPADDSGLVADVARAVHEKGLRLLWIPYYDAEGWDHWRAFGFDEAWLQPNYFFDRAVPAIRLDSAVARAERTGMGLEIEFDGRILGDPKYTDRLGPYVAALMLNPALRDRSIAIYDGEGALAALSRNRAPANVVRYRGLCISLRR